jgi:polysaccharide pyruvyl transferase WcaK-like protein
VKRPQVAGRDAGIHRAPRVGFFGNLGSGNIGNDASMEAVLAYLRRDHPDAEIDALCGRPDVIRSRYGIRAVPLYWFTTYEKRVSGVRAIPLKLTGKVADVFRVAAWTRRQDVVIIPGMGVLEASLPLRPWGFPYTMFLMCASSRLFGTKVAMVSVGAGTINQQLTRRLFDAAARLSYYRSYRNEGSREAMRRRGLDVDGDNVYPDLAFGLKPPLPQEPADPKTVCVGVMDYHGSNDDRKRAEEIHAAYVAGMKRFVRWLVDDGRTVRLLIGDTNGSDGKVVDAILDDLREYRPEAVSAQVTAQSVVSLDDVMGAMTTAGSVVAIRFHNVLAALKLSKPTVAISYSPKHDALMADMGVPEFRLPVDPLDVDLLIEQFTALEAQAPEVEKVLTDHNATNERLLNEQFAALTELLFPPARRRADTL